MKKQDMINAMEKMGITGANMSMSKAEIEAMYTQAMAQDTTQAEQENTEDMADPIEQELAEMQRANRVTIQQTEQGYVAHFYRTHKHVGDIAIKTENGAHSNAGREQARGWAISQCPQYGIYWMPELQEQAWERKYAKYHTDEQVFEDATILLGSALEVAGKSKMGTDILDVRPVGVQAGADVSYTTAGKYNKDNAWCNADIEFELVVGFSDGREMAMPFFMQMKSGQICKPKMTISKWDAMIKEEMEMQGMVA